MRRKVVEIDEARCDGCGDCIPSCAEGAIQLVDGKARLLADVLCDGIGACLGECPQGAIRVVEREAAAFDERAVEAHLASRGDPRPPPPRRPSLSVVQAPAPAGSGGCPGSRSMDLGAAGARRPEAGGPPGPAESRLSHWPVQLDLVSPRAPWLAGAALLVAADCVPFAYAAFPQEFLAGRREEDGTCRIRYRPDVDRPWGETVKRWKPRGGIRTRCATA